MKVHTFERTQRLDAPPERVFEFFSDAFNLERITPPWLRFRVTTPPPIEMGEGTLIRYRLRLHGIPIGWLTRIESWDPPHGFSDLQLRGPYRHWHHTHLFEPDGDGTLITDTVRYAMRGGPIGELVRGRLVEPDIERIFEWRRARVAELLAAE